MKNLKGTALKIKRKYRTKQGFRYLKDNHPTHPYLSLMGFYYYSKRYKNYVFIPHGRRSDGATGAWDIISLAWWVHDELCLKGKWSNGERCTNWQASTVLFDILKSEGRNFRDHWWKYSTFLFGGKECKKNGMFKLKGVV